MRTAGHGIHRSLDPDAILECDQMCAVPVDAADQFPAFDDLQVVETEPMPRRANELVIRRVMRRGENGAKALALLRAIGRVELDLVHALLVVDDAALRAEELDENASLAAPRRAVER